MDSFWKVTFDEWRKVHFTEPLWYLSIIISIIVGILNFKKTKLHISFLCYSLMAILLFVVYDLVSYYESNSTSREKIYEVINTLFCLVEIFVFYFFFSHKLKSLLFRSILRILVWIYFILVFSFYLCIYFSVFDVSQIHYLSYQMTVVEFFILLICCLIYFYELLSSDPAGSTFNLGPTFWIIASLFLYCIISLPFFIIARNLFQTNREIFFWMFSLHYVSLSFLFFCLAKAFYAKSF